MSDGKRYPLAQAKAVAERLVKDLEPYCERIQIAGSIRRGKPEVGDVEILYVPRVEMEAGADLFGTLEPRNLADEELTEWITEGFLRKRLNAKGSEMWGEKNKLGVDSGSGIPVDFFSTTHENWYNAMVCRTGPSDSNKAIAMKANEMGLTWNVYGCGFKNLATGEILPMKSEAQVFATVGLPCPEFQR